VASKDAVSRGANGLRGLASNRRHGANGWPPASTRLPAPDPTQQLLSLTRSTGKQIRGERKPSLQRAVQRPVPLRTYLVSVGLESGLMLWCALPFILAALWHSRTRRWGLVVLVGSLVILENAVSELPRVSWLEHLHWHWQATILTTAWPLLLASLAPGLSLAFIGVTSRLKPGWLKPGIVALLIAAAIPTAVFIHGSRVSLTGEGWAYLLVMPGLAEEILYRGLYQSLLNRALGRCWHLGGAELGWGLLITSVLFAGSNGLVAVDRQLHAHIVLPAAIAPFIASLVSGWVRERTNSVWPSVVGHNLSNIVIPVATLVSRFIR
jgi:membrane protease YdiL (CAAX protease family)